MSDSNSELHDDAEVVRPPEELQTSHLLSPEETPSPGDAAPRPEDAAGSQLHDMEPSLQIYQDSPKLPVVNAETVEAGDDIDFPLPHSEMPGIQNSPDIPGASSVMITDWDARDMQQQSPRSDRSSYSSAYLPDSARTSTTGGPEPPRSLVRSREPKADLNSGDVVMLTHQGRPYVAIQARLPYKDDAWHTCLELAEEGAAPESEALSYLEVVKQGPFIGFRAGAAGNRFMQPRRKAPHKLVFFNQNCGVWEHWDVLGDNWRTTPWASLPIVFRSRRLPQVQLAVEVVRVGYFTAPGMAGLPPQRLHLPVIPEDPQLEDRNLRRISNLLIAEWFKFVDHEKVLREGVELDVAALNDEFQELKLKTIRQIEYLRVQMNEEMASLSHHVTARDVTVAMLRRCLQRAQQLAADRMARQRHRRILEAWRIVVDDIVYRKTAILKLSRKREHAIREAAFRAWTAHTRAALVTAAKLRQAVQRRSHAIMSRTLQGWQQVVAQRAWRGRMMMAAVQRRTARRISVAFTAWRQLTAQRAVGRRALLRALHGVNMSWLAAALTTLRVAAQATRQKNVQADLLVARRAGRVLVAVLDAWRDQVLTGRIVDRHARLALLRRVLVSWRQAAVAALTCQAAADQLAAARMAALRRDVLTTWHAEVVARMALRLRLGKHVMARAAALQGLALAAWTEAVRERRRRRALLQRHLMAVGLRTALAVMVAWKTVTTRTVWRRVRIIAALGRAATRRMSTALLAWRSYASSRRALSGRAALAVARLSRMRMGSCLDAWHHIAARLQLARATLISICKQMLSCTLSAAFREWRLVTATAVATRAAVARALPAQTRELLAQLLATWWARHCPMTPGYGDGLVPSRGATDGGAGLSGVGVGPSDGPGAGYAASATAAATATAAEPLATSAAATAPWQMLAQSYDMAVQTASTAPSRGGSRGRAPATAEPGFTSTEAQVATHGLAGHQQGVAADSSAGAAAAQVHVEPVLSAATPAVSQEPCALASPALAPPTAGRPPAHPPTPAAAASPSPPISAMPLQRRPRGSSTGGSAAAAAPVTAQLPEFGFAVSPVHTPMTITPSPIRAGRSYREVLVAGAAAAAAAAAAAVGSGRSSSTGRLRSSGTGMSGGSSPGPFVPANTALIGPGSSPVLLEMAPRSTEGPLTPVGLPELLDGSMELSRVSSLAGGFGVGAPAATNSAAVPAETLQEVHSLLQPAVGTPTAARSLGFAAAPAEEAEQQQQLLHQQHLRALGVSALTPGSALDSSSRSQQLASAASRRAATRSGLGRWLAGAVLSHWRRVVEARRGWMACLQGVAEVRRRRLAGDVLKAWRQLADASSAMVAAAGNFAIRAKARSDLSSLRKVLSVWHVAARHRATVRVLVDRQLVRTGASKARRALLGWHAVAVGRTVAETKVERHTARRQQVLLSGVFSAWRDEVAASVARSAAAIEVANSQARGLLVSALRGWSTAAAARRERAARQARAARYASRRRLVGAFRVWRWAAEAATEREAMAERVSRAAALRAAFGGWLQMTSGGRALGCVDPESSLQRAVNWHQRRLVKGCLGALAAHRERGASKLSSGPPQDQQQRHDCAVAHWTQSTGVKVLAAWRAQTSWSRWGATEVTRMRARAGQRLQMRCLSAWLAVTEAAGAARDAAERMATRRERTQLSGLLAGWQAVAAESVEWRLVRLRACAALPEAACSGPRTSAFCILQTFSAWVEAAAERRADRKKRHVARRRLEANRLRRVLAEWRDMAAELTDLRGEADRRLAACNAEIANRAFAGWADVTKRLRAAREVAVTRGSVADRTLLRHALACWTEAVERMRRASEAAEAMAARRASEVLPTVMRAWADLACEDAARRLQVAALRNLVDRRRLAFAKRTFGAWRGVVAERHARDDELRRCIKRKKLAFSLFKQWYWEAFDADVQATISRMFHSTDPAAHSPEPSSRLPPGGRHLGPALQQPLPAYLLQHQQYVNRRTAGTYGGSAVRSTDMPPLALEMDTETAVDGTDSRSRSSVQQQQHGLRASRGAAYPTATSHPHVQSRMHPSLQQQPMAPVQEGETVRTLASTFDAVAAPAAGRQRLATLAVATPQAAATAGRRESVMRSSAYPVLRPSDSDSEHDDLRGLPLGNRTAANAPRRRDSVTVSSNSRLSKPSSKPEATSASYPRRSSIVATSATQGGAVISQVPKTSVFGRTTPLASTVIAGSSKQGGTTSSTGRRTSVARTSIAATTSTPTSGATGPVAATTRSGAGGDTAAAAAAAAAAVAAAVPGMEAMNAALGVALRSLDLMTVMAQNSGAAAAGINRDTPTVVVSGRPSRGTISSVGSAAAPPSLATRISGDGSTAAAATGGALPMSPLSPAPMAPFNAAYGHGVEPAGSGGHGSSGAVLPGVLPTWRQVANNQLYSCEEEWYGDDLGPVDPLYVSIAGAGAGVGLGGATAAAVGANSDARNAEENEPEAGAADLATRLADALSVRGLLVTGLVDVDGGANSTGPGSETSTYASGRVSSDAGSGTGTYFPRHSIFRNAVFRPQVEPDEEEEENGVSDNDAAEAAGGQQKGAGQQAMEAGLTALGRFLAGISDSDLCGDSEQGSEHSVGVDAQQQEQEHQDNEGEQEQQEGEGESQV